MANTRMRVKPAPSEINYGKMRFLITDRPTDYTIVQYIDELKKHSAKVRRDFSYLSPHKPMITHIGSSARVRADLQDGVADGKRDFRVRLAIRGRLSATKRSTKFQLFLRKKDTSSAWDARITWLIIYSQNMCLLLEEDVGS